MINKINDNKKKWNIYCIKVKHIEWNKYEVCGVISSPVNLKIKRVFAEKNDFYDFLWSKWS